MTLPSDDLTLLETAQHSHPHAVLGMHPTEQGLVFRSFQPGAATCFLVERRSQNEEVLHPMQRVGSSGLFEGVIRGRKETFAYQIRTTTDNGEAHQIFDPYNYLPTLSEDDLYWINQGTHHHIYQKLGAHPRMLGEVSGFGFAVWAPSAKAVSLVGDFNGWDARTHPMRPLGNSGVWELFLPGMSAGQKYKYRIKGADGHDLLKTDPYGTYFEAPPHNASVTWPADASDHQWGDEQWMQQRSETDWTAAPVSIYEVHLGSWKRKVEDGGRPFTYREMAGALCEYVVEMGFTHVEFMPLMEFPFEGSWGYQVTGFFAPTHRYGTPDDFKYMVDQLHQHGIGVLLDWVPAHFPRDAFALAEFDGTHLYEHADPRKGAHMDWGTLIFNYGRHEVRNFLVGSALSWFDRYHIDGLRVDAVPGLLAQCRGVGAQPVWRARKHRGHCLYAPMQ